MALSFSPEVRAVELPTPTPVATVPPNAPPSIATPSSTPASPVQGIEALCTEVARVVAPQISSAASVDVQVVAEGATVDIADSVRGRCASELLARRHGLKLAAAADHVVHVRLRASAAQLLALVDVSGGDQATAAAVATVAVPLGPALETWLAAGGRGVEIWVIGNVEGEVLALCGATAGNASTLAFVTRDRVLFYRWSGSGLTALGQADLPAPLRSRARSPAASAVCRSADGALAVALGFHDRGQGGLLKWAGTTPTWLDTLEGVPIGFDTTGAPILATAVEGTNLIRWKGQKLSQATAWGNKGAPTVYGMTPGGAFVAGEHPGKSQLFGSDLAVADLNHDGTQELVVSWPVYPADGAEDRLVVRSLAEPAVVRQESRPLKGVFGALGLVTESDGARIVAAAQTGGGHTQVFAVGRRLSSSAH